MNNRAAGTLVACSLLVTSVGLLIWRCAEGPAGLLYIPLFLLALVPGVRLGFALFGRRHAASWIAGALLGYALTAVTLSVAIRLGARTMPVFLVAWMTLLAASWAVTRRLHPPLISIPSWSRRDTAALVFVLCLVPVLMGPPYSKNGVQDDGGNRYYRAYFTADFLWHMALTAELTRFSLPPRNPYLADRTLHYYWMYFVVPAAGASMLTGDHIVEACLEINAVLCGVLFVSAIFLATWTAVPNSRAVAVGVGLSLVAASLQGWYGLYDLYSRGRPLDGVRDLNIWALTNWFLNGLRIDGLPRSLWWTPQHAAACALGLIAVVAAGHIATVRHGAILLIGVALGSALMFSPLIGGAFVLVYGLSVILAAEGLRTHFVRLLVRHAAAVIPVTLALAWCVVNEMFEGAGSALLLGFGGLARNAPAETLMLALGPLLLPAVLGLFLPNFPRAAISHVIGVALGLGLLYFVRLGPDPAWVGFRAGQILQILLPALVAVFVARTATARPSLKIAGAGLLVVCFLAGVPTTVIDVYNAQDIGNRRMGPGFRWTIDITPAEQAAFAWIKQSLPATAVVQMEPTSRGRETWTLIPSLAERRMAAGLPISLIDDPEYHRRSDLVKLLYQTRDAAQARTIAAQLGLDYVYVDRTERAAFGDGVLKFETLPELFAPVYRNSEVIIAAVRR